MRGKTAKQINRDIAKAEAAYRAAKFRPLERIRLINLISRLKEQRASKIGMVKP